MAKKMQCIELSLKIPKYSQCVLEIFAQHCRMPHAMVALFIM